MKRASDILGRLLDETADEQARSGSGVFRSWAKIVGSPLADHSRVYELQHGQLCVEVDHPGWLQVLLLRKTQILQGVGRAYPQLAVRGLRARVNPRYAEGSPAPASRRSDQVGGEERVGRRSPEGTFAGTDQPPPPPGPTPSTAPVVEQAVSAAGPEDLKARLRRLFAASLRRSERGPDRG